MKWANENRYTDLIQDAAIRHGVPYPLVQAVIAVESQFNPGVQRAEPAIQDASIGLMQILLGTARGQGYFGEAGDPSALTGLFDPATNINAGTSYLAGVFAQVGWDAAAAASAYNGGYRPSIGFGAKADHPMQICLARDQSSGKCIRYRNVLPGEFSNQEYVNAVLANLEYFNAVRSVSTGAGQFMIPLLPTGATNPKLIGALSVLLAGLMFWRSRRKLK